MVIINWLKFLYALWQLYPEAKKLWNDVQTQYKTVKDAPKPTVDDFKTLVKDSFKDALTPVAEVQSGLKSDGSAK